MRTLEKTVDALVLLINSKPRSPTRDELFALLREHAPLAVSARDDEDEEFYEAPVPRKKGRTITIAPKSMPMPAKPVANPIRR